MERLVVHKVTPHYCQLCPGNLRENLDFVLSPAVTATTVQGMPCANISLTLPTLICRESRDVQPAGDKTGPRGGLGLTPGETNENHYE